MAERTHAPRRLYVIFKIPFPYHLALLNLMDNKEVILGYLIKNRYILSCGLELTPSIAISGILIEQKYYQHQKMHQIALIKSNKNQ